jgi:Mycothiol maleylpyruvate isomerase N-terminal domain
MNRPRPTPRLRVRTHGYRLWVVGSLPPGSDAIALGRTVIVRRAVAERTSFEHLLRHELTHVEQWRTLGIGGFACVYIGEYIRGRRSGLSHHQSYLAISLEQEARARADSTVPDVRPIELSNVVAAHRRLELLVHALDPTLLNQPSKLPGWTVAHVLDHLVLQAGTLAGTQTPTGPTVAGDFATRLASAHRAFEQATDVHSPTTLHHRLREVEVHMADLGHRSYTYHSWSDVFVDAELNHQLPLAHRRTNEPVHLIDERQLHHFIGSATRSPAIHSTRRAIVAWLLSREHPEHLPHLQNWSTNT